jgi:hypothetical protein
MVNFERKKGIDIVEFILSPKEQHFFTNADIILVISLVTVLASEVSMMKFTNQTSIKL